MSSLHISSQPQFLFVQGKSCGHTKSLGIYVKWSTAPRIGDGCVCGGGGGGGIWGEGVEGAVAGLGGGGGGREGLDIR